MLQVFSVIHICDLLAMLANDSIFEATPDHWTIAAGGPVFATDLGAMEHKIDAGETVEYWGETYGAAVVLDCFEV